MSFVHFTNLCSHLRRCIIKELNHSSRKTFSSSSTNFVDTSQTNVNTGNKVVKMSKAMRAYLDRAMLYEKFIKEQMDEYEIGRRHLANMMGEDPDTFTQDDINKAVEYLMPSGLFQKKARPIFEHPTKLFPKHKDAEFDENGRPYNFLFYTGRPNFYSMLHEISEKLIQLNNHEDKMIAKGIFKAFPEEKANINGMEWKKKEEIDIILTEKLSDIEYERFLKCITRLAAHPYSNREMSFIEQFCNKLVAVTQVMEVDPLLYDENGRPYMEKLGKRKKTIVNVIVRGNGTGKFEIDGRDILMFDATQDREHVMFPLDFTGMMNKVDVEAKTIRGIGNSALSGAIRLGLSIALCSFLPKEMVERMRLAGLLTRDPRIHERKKVGQPSARKKATWKKR